MTQFTTNLQPNGILAFEGPDSIKFLQGQTTCNLDDLSETNGLYGAFCNPKGRIKTTFILIKQSEQSLLMLLDKDQCAYLQEQLKMYIAFFKSEISDVSEKYHLLGAIEEGENNTTTISVEHQDDHMAVTLPGKPVRKLLISQSQPEITEASTNGPEWLIHDIQNGMVWTTEPTREQFLPHDINLPGLGGVSYDKGCYTGQEIVARMHYRGNPKYTTAVLMTEDPNPEFEASLKAHVAEDKIKSIGQPISAVISDGNKTYILASVHKDLLQQQEISLSIAAERTILCTINKPFLG